MNYAKNMMILNNFMNNVSLITKVCFSLLMITSCKTSTAQIEASGEYIPVNISENISVFKINSFSVYDERDPKVILPNYPNQIEASSNVHVNSFYLLSSYLSADTEEWMASCFCNGCEVKMRNIRLLKQFKASHSEKMEVHQNVEFEHDGVLFNAIKVTHTGMDGARIGVRVILTKKENGKWVITDNVPPEIEEFYKWSMKIKKEYGKYFLNILTAYRDEDKIPKTYFQLIRECSSLTGFNFSLYRSTLNNWEKNKEKEKINGLYDKIDHWGF